MESKHSYRNIIIFSVVILASILIILINPHTFQRGYFNESYDRLNFEPLDISTNYKIIDYIDSRTRYISDVAVDLKTSRKITNEQSDEIIKLSIEAQRELSSYKLNNDENSLNKSLFFTQKAISYRKAYPFINCANEVYNLSKKYHWLFYYLNHNDKERVLGINETRTRLENFLRYSTNFALVEDKERLINVAKEVENLEERNDLYKLKCDEFKVYLEKDYNKQRGWFLIKLLSLIIIFFAGMILGAILSKRKTIDKKAGNLFNRIKDIFSPKEIKNKTISSILKISSVTTTLVAILGIALNSFLNNVLIVVIILVSVISSLLSILLGVIALNNEQEAYKKWSYRTFVFGLFLFVVFFAYLIIGGILAEFVKAIGESARNYLNNQTAIK